MKLVPNCVWSVHFSSIFVCLVAISNENENRSRMKVCQLKEYNIETHKPYEAHSNYNRFK